MATATRPGPSAVIAVAAPVSPIGVAAPPGASAVTVARSGAPALNVTSERVATSYTAAWTRADSGNTVPGRAAVAGGDSAARAGAMVGGGASAGFDEQAPTSMIAEMTRPMRTG